MRIARQTHIVVKVQSQTLGKRLRRVCLALIHERLRTTAKVFLDDRLHTILPMGQGCLGVLADDASHGALQFREEHLEISQRIARQRTWCRHGILRTDAVLADNLQHVVTRATL